MNCKSGFPFFQGRSARKMHPGSAYMAENSSPALQVTLTNSKGIVCIHRREEFFQKKLSAEKSFKHYLYVSRTLFSLEE
jgi:hypothetical protein